MAPLFDAHNHLQDEWLTPDRERILTELGAAGVSACVVNGTSESDWPEVAALCRSANRDQPSAISHQPDVGGVPPPRNSGPLSQLSTLNSQLLPPNPKPKTQNQKPKLVASFGLHPWDVGNRTPAWREKLIGFLDADSNACMGEIGLDRWMTDRAKPDDPRLAGLRRAPLAEQLEVFHLQLALASERNLPTTIHCIDAYGALLDALGSVPRPRRGFLLHSYAGSVELVKPFAKLGAYFSFNGYFLDPRRAVRLRPVYAAIPADRLLVESDAPAMSLPVASQRFQLPNTPTGSVVNHPANLIVAYEELARWRDTDAASLAARIAENFTHFFCR
jgi:TatD DNase family protein